MDYKILLIPSLLFFLGCSSDETKQVVKSENSVQCQILKTSKVRCTFKTQRVDKTQGVEFNWISPATKEDNRHRILTLPNNHATVYDERDTDGRASGIWKVSASLNGEVVSTSFRL